jgi:hypothetical protein
MATALSTLLAQLADHIVEGLLQPAVVDAAP